MTNINDENGRAQCMRSCLHYNSFEGDCVQNCNNCGAPIQVLYQSLEHRISICPECFRAEDNRTDDVDHDAADERLKRVLRRYETEFDVSGYLTFFSEPELKWVTERKLERLRDAKDAEIAQLKDEIDRLQNQLLFANRRAIKQSERVKKFKKKFLDANSTINALCEDYAGEEVD